MSKPKTLNIEPSRERLTALVEHCERRVMRAVEKLDAATTEQREAASALASATGRLADWLEANPEPQMELPNV